MTHPAPDLRARIELLPTVVGLPAHMYVEYFGKLQDGREFIIYRPRAQWEYKDFRCLIERGSVFVLHEIIKTTRYRDGGTTDIEIAEGTFHFPTPFKPEETNTFNGQALMRYWSRE